MKELFFQVLDMSVSATWLALAVMLFRVALRKAPKYLHCILWAMVALRLICPSFPESQASLIPDSEPVSMVVLSGQENPSVITPVQPPVDLPQSTVPQETKPEPVGWEDVLSVVWITGVAAMTAYSVVSYLLLRRKVAASVAQDGAWLCDDVASPFILGIIRPRIYLPSGLAEDCRESVLAHERAHLHRKDHWWKPLGFVLLAIHWFNPVMWLAYILLCRDIEAACDERVIKDMDTQARKQYSEALLSCAVPRRYIAACPLAFGEQGVKGRIKSVLNYKKPAIWIILAALAASTVLAVCFLTNPIDHQDGTPEKAPASTEPSGGLHDVMNMTIEYTIPSGLAFETDCFYAMGDDGKFYRVYWSDMEDLSEGQSICVTYLSDSKKKIEYPNGYPDGGYTPQYEITALAVETVTVEPSVLDDAALRSIADAAVRKRFALTNLDNYEISYSRHETYGTASVEYRLYLFGYRTSDFYIVYLNEDGSIIDISSDDSKYARYLSYATEAAFASAKEKLDAKAPNGSDYYLDIDSEGYLCLCREVIRYIDPPVSEDGYVMSGCGIDHEHLFFSERICYYK